MKRGWIPAGRFLVVAAGMAMAGAARGEEKPASTSPPGAGGASVEEIEKLLVEKWGQVRSLSAKRDILSEMRAPEGTATTESTGKILLQRTDRGWLMRLEMRADTVSNYGSKLSRIESSSVSISDGEYTYTDAVSNDKRRVVKTNIDPAQQLDVAALFAALRKHGNVRVLTDEVVDGQKVYAVASEKPEGPEAGTELVYYFARDTGVLLKQVLNNPSRYTRVTTRLSNVDLNKDIASSEFKFTPPEDQSIVDMTKPK
ncbi:MAG: hypothetical protein HY763_11805 [Planctomycetes bacterium]|nr:hypothetical protein [Planctomycetota bacterium]